MKNIGKLWFILTIVEAVFVVTLGTSTILLANKVSQQPASSEKTITLFVAMETTSGSVKITINNDSNKEYIVTDETDDIEITACPGDVISISEINPERPLHIYTYTDDISNKTEIYASSSDLNYNSTWGNIGSYEFVVSNTNYYLSFTPMAI